MKNKRLIYAFVVSLLIHIAIFIPFSNKKLQHRRANFFVVDLKKVKNVPVKENEIAYEQILKENIMENHPDLKGYLYSSQFLENGTDVPDIDIDEYGQQVLTILQNKLEYKDYLKDKNLSGEYLFEIAIEGSGRVRKVDVVRSNGSKELEDYVITNIYRTIFPPHGELVLKIKVNMLFTLDE
jgi:hypothetical protein